MWVYDWVQFWGSFWPVIKFTFWVVNLKKNFKHHFRQFPSFVFWEQSSYCSNLESSNYLRWGYCLLPFSATSSPCCWKLLCNSCCCSVLPPAFSSATQFAFASLFRKDSAHVAQTRSVICAQKGCKARCSVTCMLHVALVPWPFTQPCPGDSEQNTVKPWWGLWQGSFAKKDSCQTFDSKRTNLSKLQTPDRLPQWMKTM